MIGACWRLEIPSAPTSVKIVISCSSMFETMDSVWKGVIFAYDATFRQSDKAGSKREAFGHVERRLHTAGAEIGCAWASMMMSRSPAPRKSSLFFFATVRFRFWRNCTASTANTDAHQRGPIVNGFTVKPESDFLR